MMALVEVLVEEVLLRFPPSDPASLVRAALVCKNWYRIVADPGFRRRFRELHRTPPLLGFLCHSADEGHFFISHFFTTSSCLIHTSHLHRRSVDARHGRVLFFAVFFSCFIVWDPVTGEDRELPELQLANLSNYWNVAVLCAAHGACDHLDCHAGPFLVVVVRSDGVQMHVHIYSSETGSWSEATSVAHPPTEFKPVPAALLGSALHFLTTSKHILKYELTARNISMIQLPSGFSMDCAVLTTVEDGGLGLAGMKDSRLYLWSMETDPKGDIGWAQIRVIQLQMLLPVNATILYHFVAIAHSVGVVFVETNEGLFSIDLKAHNAKKVCGPYGTYSVIPYMSFYTPALRMASTGDGLNGGA